MIGRLRTYLAVVATVGCSLLVPLAFTVDPDRLRGHLAAVLILAVFVLVGHFFSIPLSREGRGPAILVDGPFAFALAVFGGVGVAALVQAISYLLYGAARRRPALKVAFNIGVHTIGIAVGAGLWTLLGGGRPVGRSSLAMLLAAAAAFMAVKFLLVTAAVALDSVRPDVRPRRMLRLTVGAIVMTQAVVVLIVLSSDLTVVLGALGLLAVAAHLLLRSEARATLDRDEAERTARREAELRRQEHELRIQQQDVARKLRETDQMKDDLLAMVSHELRTPLTTVVGALRLLSTGAPLSADERQEMLEMADRQARRLRLLIEQLLLAAQTDRGESGFPPIAAELVDADAADLVLQAATEARAGNDGHPIRVERDGGLPVRVAPDATMQILGNLLDNACKYSPEDRPVWLTAERERDEVVVAVEDDGAGVPPGDRERIFERFTRLGGGRGLGLGLYIARELARAQGGDLLLADARHATGARFELRIPVNAAQRPAAPPDARALPDLGQEPTGAR